MSMHVMCYRLPNGHQLVQKYFTGWVGEVPLTDRMGSMAGLVPLRSATDSYLMLLISRYEEHRLNGCLSF